LAPPPRSNRFGSPLVLSRVHWVLPELVAEVKSYRTQASKASVMLIAAKADHELLLYIDGKLHLILAE
jgi:hypothetical protein